MQKPFCDICDNLYEPWDEELEVIEGRIKKDREDREQFKLRIHMIDRIYGDICKQCFMNMLLRAVEKLKSIS